MDPWHGKDKNPMHVPRPGHADLAGGIKYHQDDLRNILERASARETAMRVAIGSITRQMLEEFGVWIGSHVIQIHTVQSKSTFQLLCDMLPSKAEQKFRQWSEMADQSNVRCIDERTGKRMRKSIDDAKKMGDSVGGVFELVATNVPIGLGSHVMWDRRLDARIAAEIMSIPAIKSVEIGIGSENASRFGSKVHDPIIPGDHHPVHATNRAGGIEGGISNGEPIIVRAVMKPIPTLTQPLASVDLHTGRPVDAHKERSDVCAVPAASIVGEAMLSIALGKAFCEKFGGDSIHHIRRHVHGES